MLGAHKITGLGKRLSLRLVQLLGRNMVGLGYAVCVSGVCIAAIHGESQSTLTWSATAWSRCGVELLLGPIVPSNTARGSIVMAIVTSLCQTLGASPTKNRKSHGGEYLMLVASHANLIAAATYQTGTTHWPGIYAGRMPKLTSHMII